MGRFPAPVWSGKYLLQEPTQPPHAAEVHDLLGGRATRGLRREPRGDRLGGQVGGVKHVRQPERRKARSTDELTPEAIDRKSTRLNSSHANNSYAVFCLKQK